MSAALFPVRSAADFLFRYRPLSLTLGDKVQYGLQVKKAGSFNLPRFPDGYAAEVSLARAFVKFGTGKAAVKFYPLFGRAYPDGQAVGLVR